MRAVWTVVMLAVLAPVAASASDGWVCTATGSWALCLAGGDQCTSHAIEEHAARADEEVAREAAVDACRQETGIQRVRAAFLADADLDPGQTTRVDAACTVDRCTEGPVQLDPYADAFDDPVCIGVRQYICSICGDTSTLCRQVQTEQPVTANACSQTHARLATFSDLLGQVDSLQPGTWTDARRELCGVQAL